MPKLISPAEYASAHASKANLYFMETIGGNAIRKWATSGTGESISWHSGSKPSLQEALDAYDDRIFLNPLAGGRLDIGAGDPSLKSSLPLTMDGIELDLLDLVDSEVETALRKTMILNRLVQLQREITPDPTYAGILKMIRKILYNMSPVEVNVLYDQLKGDLPRGGDYDFPPGCPGV